MSKPLELTVHRKFEDRLGAEWYVWKDTCVLPWIADEYGNRKRLADAELAAEVFSAIFHEAECEVRGMRLERKFPAHPVVAHYVKKNHEFGRQADILKRFATLPSYDESV